MTVRSLPCYFLVAFLFTAFSSCKNNQKAAIVAGTPVVIDLDSGISHLSLVDYVEDPRLINLDSSKDGILSEAWGIRKVIQADGKYFLLDGKYMAIKVFDSVGRYLYSIGKLGVGSGQFVRLETMEYLPSRHSLMVLCNNPPKISEFSLDGRLKLDKGLDFYATAVAFPSPNRRIYYVNQNTSDLSGDKNLLFADSLNRIQDRLFDLPQNIRSTIQFSGGLFSVNGEVYINPAFCDTFFSILNDTVRPAFKISYGKKDVPYNISETFLMNHLGDFSFQYGTFVKTRDYIGFNYRSDYVSTAYYGINSRHILVSDKKMDSLNVLFANSIFQANDTCIAVLDMQRLSGFISRHLDDIRARLPTVYRNLILGKTYKNPVLLIFKLKSGF